MFSDDGCCDFVYVFSYVVTSCVALFCVAKLKGAVFFLTFESLG